MENEQSTTLFIGDLSIHCTERDVRKLFRSHGLIDTIRIKRNKNVRTNLCYGFVKFSTKEEAEAAMRSLNGAMLLGRCIRIGWASSKDTAAPLDGHVDRTAPKQQTAQLHVSFISKQVDALVSESTIRNLFASFGEVLDVTIKKSQYDKNLSIQNGYGFVHYPLTVAGVTAAIQAVNSLHQVTIDRITYDCSISRSLEQQLIAWNIPLPHSHVMTMQSQQFAVPQQHLPSSAYYSPYGPDFGSITQPALPHQPPIMMPLQPPISQSYYGQQEMTTQPRIMQHHPMIDVQPMRQVDNLTYTKYALQHLTQERSQTVVRYPVLPPPHLPQQVYSQHQDLNNERSLNFQSQSFSREPSYLFQKQDQILSASSQQSLYRRSSDPRELAGFEHLSLSSSSASIPLISASISRSIDYSGSRVPTAATIVSPNSYARQSVPMSDLQTPSLNAHVRPSSMQNTAAVDLLDALIDQTLSTSATNEERKK